MKKFLLKTLSSTVGFTLIEIIIAVTIVVILTTVGIASYNSSNARNSLQRQAAEFRSLARKIKSDAVASSKPTGNCTTSGQVYGSYIIFQKSSANYTYGIACFDAAGTSYNTATLGTLPTGYTFIWISGGNNFLTFMFTFDGKVIRKFTATQAQSVPIQSYFTAATPSFTQVVLLTSSVGTYFIYFSSTGLICEQPSTAPNPCST